MKDPAMSRTPTPRSETRLVELAPGALDADRAAADTLAALQAGTSAERDLLNQLLGQAQMADAIAKFSRTVRLTKLAFVRENKLYQQLAGKQMPNGSALRGTWEEFCELLGYSKDKVDLDLQNLQSFGEEALESMSRMGIGYRDMKQYRRLPEDAKTLLIETAKTGDKAAFLDLAEELVERHAKQKADLEAKLDDATKTLQAKDAVLAQVSTDLNAAKEKLARPWTPNPELGTRSATEDAALEELAKAADASAQSARRLGVVVADICANQTNQALRTKALQALTYVVVTLREVVIEHGLEVEVSDDALGTRPAWMNAAWQQPSDDTTA
ncbi:hypothetical protein VITFI_CDS1518 [Vitreoscilla filiformis]|uniref:Uncharacterized protein n=2 Tax=Vitreoscilla filiformis TaxID=63 RepID=A0A221KBL1_VITFI|nr:hypothetical protein VITFI_CDS0126 [Vitreoscilla filiformis]ASM76421.1 hypothetical protein VITFI_CDS0642 [Vitreoscilla filiformis]ASM76855.1 hypothetical protein VITFI_CDS1077 [Vitreoscilla filiformis]ASM77296.1 hypothetical protein VITFI_CDS1518 [Vitreoscilla filiformis]